MKIPKGSEINNICMLCMYLINYNKLGSIKDEFTQCDKDMERATKTCNVKQNLTESRTHFRDMRLLLGVARKLKFASVYTTMATCSPV